MSEPITADAKDKSEYLSICGICHVPMNYSVEHTNPTGPYMFTVIEAACHLHEKKTGCVSSTHKLWILKEGREWVLDDEFFEDSQVKYLARPVAIVNKILLEEQKAADEANTKTD